MRARLLHAGFDVVDEADRSADLLAMRDAVRAKLDYDGLLAALGARGRELLEATRAIDAAIDAGELGYVAMVALKPNRP